jgi:ABC-type uncharacterized transport system permease subunit
MIIIINKLLYEKNMSKFLIINIVVLMLFFIFVMTNSFVKFTTLGYIVVGIIYLFINFFIYFSIRFLSAIENKKTTN